MAGKILLGAGNGPASRAPNGAMRNEENMETLIEADPSNSSYSSALVQSWVWTVSSHHVLVDIAIIQYCRPFLESNPFDIAAKGAGALNLAVGLCRARRNSTCMQHVSTTILYDLPLIS